MYNCSHIDPKWNLCWTERLPRRMFNYQTKRKTLTANWKSEIHAFALKFTKTAKRKVSCLNNLCRQNAEKGETRRISMCLDAGKRKLFAFVKDKNLLVIGKKFIWKGKLLLSEFPSPLPPSCCIRRLHKKIHKNLCCERKTIFRI